MMTDPIADMLTRIRNAAAVKKQEVSIPFSKIKLELARILEKEGFVRDVEEKKEPHAINIHLKYVEQKSIIGMVKRISKPGCKVYRGWKDLLRVHNGFGIAVVSTSQGLITDKEARKKKIGGEIICEIY